MYEGPIQDLIDELSRLPGIGPKSAQRLAFHVVKAPPDDAKRLAESIVQAKERIFFCKECGNVAEGELCRICRDEGRDRTTLCVVEEPKDVSTIEKAGVIKGRYHVLGGAISPMDGVGPEARGISLESLRGKIAASVSCHAAIKINMALDETKMNWLLRELARTECPMTCPHGRPIVLKYSMKEIQKAFKRI